MSMMEEEKNTEKMESTLNRQAYLFLSFVSFQLIK